jgi:hypothetical protein
VAGVAAPALGVVAAALLLAACGGDAVHVDGYHVAAGDRDACRAFLQGLPAKVADQPRRDVSGSPYAVAWGDPALVLRCGVRLPQDFASSPCITRNGIGWSVPLDQADDLDLDAVMTLAFRTPVVQVSVPAHYRPNGPSEVMADLDADVRAHTTSTGRECS